MGGKNKSDPERVPEKVIKMDIIRGDGTLLKNIDLSPKNEYQEVLQNVAIIIDTVMKSAPMLRGLGLPGELLKRPINVVENMLVAYIYDQIDEYEPRAIIGGVTFEMPDYSYPLQGILIPVVEIEGVNEDEE